MEPVDMLLGALVLLVIMGIIATVMLIQQHQRPDGNDRQDHS